MRRGALLLPVLLAMAASGSAQTYVQPRYSSPAVAASSSIDWALADWRRLRQVSGFAFADYARFLNANPGWPSETTMRRNAEKSMRPGEAAGTVLAFYASQPPESGNGFARLADALSASGRPAEALVAAREAWGSGDLGAYDEQSIFARYGAYFSRADHDRHADALLFAKRPGDAQRFLSMVTPSRAGAFAARLAMQNRAPDAEARYQRFLTSSTSDAGLMMDRARYLRESGFEAPARQLFARPRILSYRPADPERFYEMMLLLARGAASDGQWSTAYNIARQVDDIYPAGTDISLKPLGIRDDYTSLTWLAGTAALDALGRPGDAIGLFDRYSRGGRSLQVASKGLYWAGRAAAQAGRTDSSLYFQRAASYPELFYGQLALERLGRSVPAPFSPIPALTEAQRAAFGGNRLVRAVRLLGTQGRRDDQALFVRALAESMTNDGDRQLAVQLGQQIGRQDLPVWVARAARNKGTPFYVRSAYPTLGSNSLDGRVWSLAHGITRQESSFDRTAVSHAGARGLMQLMPGTAREQAGKMGYSYDGYRLTSDPNYNVMLGSAYFRRLLDTWGGNVPLAVASYNAGAGNVRKWVRAYGDPRSTDVLRWIERIPFVETKGYVQRVIENSVVYDSLRLPPSSQSAMHVSRYLGKSRPG